jgi:L-asparaginase II
MPHGSKMQTLGANLFMRVHQISMVFAMPKSYDTKRYSEGCIQTWAINLGDIATMFENLQTKRSFGTVKVIDRSAT